MSILVLDASAVSVSVDDEFLHVSLRDGRRLSTPLAWFPRLYRATPEERGRWRLIGNGEGIHWSAIDEDIAITTLLRDS